MNNSIVISKEVKSLMAFCYVTPSVIRHELLYDKRLGYLEVRIFINETDYLLVSFNINSLSSSITYCALSYYTTAKNFYAPSKRVSFLNKYFRKYKIDGDYIVDVPSLLYILSTKIFKTPHPDYFADVSKRQDKDYYGVFRATGGF